MAGYNVIGNLVATKWTGKGFGVEPNWLAKNGGLRVGGGVALLGGVMTAAISSGSSVLSIIAGAATLLTAVSTELAVRSARKQTPAINIEDKTIELSVSDLGEELKTMNIDEFLESGLDDETATRLMGKDLLSGLLADQDSATILLDKFVLSENNDEAVTKAFAVEALASLRRASAPEAASKTQLIGAQGYTHLDQIKNALPTGHPTRKKISQLIARISLGEGALSAKRELMSILRGELLKKELQGRIENIVLLKAQLEAYSLKIPK